MSLRKIKQAERATCIGDIERADTSLLCDKCKRAGHLGNHNADCCRYLEKSPCPSATRACLSPISNQHPLLGLPVKLQGYDVMKDVCWGPARVAIMQLVHNTASLGSSLVLARLSYLKPPMPTPEGFTVPNSKARFPSSPLVLCSRL